MDTIKSFFGFEVEDLPQTVKNKAIQKDPSFKSGREGQNGNSKPTSRDTILFTFLFLVINVILRVNNASYLRKSRVHVFFLWLQSLMILAFLWISKKRRRWSFISQTRHFKALPVVCCYVVHMTINECFSNGFKDTSGGSEVLQLGLATSPLLTVLFFSLFNKKAHTSFVALFIILSSLILAVIFCSDNDPYIPYQFTFIQGFFGLIHGLSLAMFVLTSKNYLTVQEMSVSELIHSINVGCILGLPFVIMFSGELDILITKGLSSHGGFYGTFITAFILALLRIFDQIVSLYHIKNYSSLLHIPARNFAWIPATLVITFSFNMELLVSSFLGFWLVGVIFIATLLESIADINS